MQTINVELHEVDVVALMAAIIRTRPSGCTPAEAVCEAEEIYGRVCLGEAYDKEIR